MCQFFSAVVTRDGRILFTEDDSHETIIQRALHIDETSTPAWLDIVETEARVRAVADRVRPTWKAYEAAQRSAWGAYLATLSTIEGYIPPKEVSL